MPIIDGSSQLRDAIVQTDPFDVTVGHYGVVGVENFSSIHLLATLRHGDTLPRLVIMRRDVARCLIKDIQAELDRTERKEQDGRDRPDPGDPPGLPD